MTKAEIIKAMEQIADDDEVSIQIDILTGGHVGEIEHVKNTDYQDIEDIKYDRYGIVLKCSTFCN